MKHLKQLTFVILICISNSVFSMDCPKDFQKIVFSENDLQRYKYTLTSPDVIYLRKALNLFLEGKMTSGAGSETEFEPLKKYDKSYYKNKFYLFTINQDLAGVWVMDIMFENRKDKVFRATTLNGYELIDFEDRNLSKCDIEKINIIYESILNNHEIAF